MKAKVQQPFDPFDESTPDGIPSKKKNILRMLEISLVFVLGGFVSATEGFYPLEASDFGQFECFGTCQSVYDSVESVAWHGIYLLLLGLSLIIAGSVLMLMIRRRSKRAKVASIFEDHLNQRRLVVTSTLLILGLSVIFLAPIIPFNQTLSSQSSFPRVSACYQYLPSVTSPVYNYQGYESMSQLLFHAGNFVYVECTVISGK